MEHLLLLQVVEYDDRRVQLRVALRLVQREARREEGDQCLAERPLLDRLMQNGLLVKEDGCELLPTVNGEARQPVEHLHHRFALGLLAHCTHADYNRPLGQITLRPLQNGRHGRHGRRHGAVRPRTAEVLILTYVFHRRASSDCGCPGERGRMTSSGHSNFSAVCEC